MSMFLLCSCFEIFFFFFCQHLQQKRHLRVLSGKSRTLQDSGNAAVWQRFMPHFGILCNKTKLSLWAALKVLFVLFKSNLASIIIIACLHVWGKYLHQVCKNTTARSNNQNREIYFFADNPPFEQTMIYVWFTHLFKSFRIWWWWWWQWLQCRWTMMMNMMNTPFSSLGYDEYTWFNCMIINDDDKYKLILATYFLTGLDMKAKGTTPWLLSDTVTCWFSFILHRFSFIFFIYFH